MGNENTKIKGDFTPEENNKSTEKKKYFVNIEGEDVEVNVKNDSEYSCLLNCLEGYYIYGNGCEDDSEEIEDDDSAEDEV